jgi:hypothetical protein
MARQLEVDIEKQITDHVKSLGGWCLKLRSPGRGFPDRTVLLPGGRVVFLEVKRPGGKVSFPQRYFITRLRKLGFPAAIVYSLDDVKDYFQEIYNE